MGIVARMTWIRASGRRADSAHQRPKLALGKTKCADGRVEFSFGNNAAANGLLQEAVKLLPRSDPCAIEARKILQGK
jgi:hypothetical protein